MGTSVGAINGALFAADPTVEGVGRLSCLWRESNMSEVTAGAVLRRITTLARTGTHLEALEARAARDALPLQRIEELSVPFQCMAASIERAAEHAAGHAAALRISLSVSRGVIASGSMRSSSSAGPPQLSACSSAGAKSAVRCTSAP